MIPQPPEKAEEVLSPRNCDQAPGLPGCLPFSLPFPGHPLAQREAPELCSYPSPSQPSPCRAVGPPGVAAGIPAAVRDGNCPHLFKNKATKDLLVLLGQQLPCSTGMRLRCGQISGRHQHPPVTHLQKSVLQARSKLPGMLKQQPYAFGFSTAFSMSDLTPHNLLSLAVTKDV